MTQNTRHKLLLRAWWPALIAVGAICVESTNSMGLAQTNAMLAGVVRWTGHTTNAVDPFDRLFRKLGHFTGYGLLGLCFARGWLSILRRQAHLFWKAAYLRAGTLGAACACLVASCDELHQRFLPSRQASLHDVLLDTCGAVTLIAAAGLLALRRHSAGASGTLSTAAGSYVVHGHQPLYGCG